MLVFLKKIRYFLEHEEFEEISFTQDQKMNRVQQGNMLYRGIRGNMGTWGIWAKLNINVEIVVADFVFSQIAVGTI